MNLSTNTPATRIRFLAAFRDHPASVGESYFGHMAFACETTASRKVAELAALCQHRGTGH